MPLIFLTIYIVLTYMYYKISRSTDDMEGEGGGGPFIPTPK